MNPFVSRAFLCSSLSGIGIIALDDLAVVGFRRALELIVLMSVLYIYAIINVVAYTNKTLVPRPISRSFIFQLIVFPANGDARDSNLSLQAIFATR